MASEPGSSGRFLNGVMIGLRGFGSGKPLRVAGGCLIASTGCGNLRGLPVPAGKPGVCLGIGREPAGVRAVTCGPVGWDTTPPFLT